MVGPIFKTLYAYSWFNLRIKPSICIHNILLIFIIHFSQERFKNFIPISIT